MVRDVLNTKSSASVCRPGGLVFVHLYISTP
jgi:hypothetical protein